MIEKRVTGSKLQPVTSEKVTDNSYRSDRSNQAAELLTSLAEDLGKAREQSMEGIVVTVDDNESSHG